MISLGMNKKSGKGMKRKLKKKNVFIVFIILLTTLMLTLWLDQDEKINGESDNFCLNSKIEFDSRIMDQMMGDPVRAINEISDTFQLYPFTDPDYIKYFGVDLKDVTLKRLRNYQVELKANEKAIQFKTHIEKLYRKNEKKIISQICKYLPVDTSFIFKVLYVNFIKERVLYEKDSVFIVNPSSLEWKDNPASALGMIVHNAVHIALQKNVAWPSLAENESRAFDKLNFLKQEIFFEGIATYISHQVLQELNLKTNSYFTGGGGEFDFDGISDKQKMKKVIRTLINDSRDLIQENNEEKFKAYFDENGGKHYMTGAYLFNVIDQKEGNLLIRKILKNGQADMLFELYNRQVPDNEKIIILTDNFL
ncbi:MAG: hypothetical protein CME62_09375 [Halobacteriovoraceae bacterium]|nr:hypothetical protein [Halobacteriovoraceae bacterium]